MLSRRSFLKFIGISPVGATISPKKKLPDQYNPTHNSLQMNRLKSVYGVGERIYAKQWKKSNERHPAINSGFTSLEWILAPNAEWPAPVSDRDAEVAASVIQWLGTNCGMAFMWECERKIEQARK